jgi:hypothetical protein
MFKKAGSRRPLRFESLERRELFSVTVKVSAGDLLIQDVPSQGPDNDQVAVFSGGVGVVVACDKGIANFGGAPWITIPWVQTAKSDLKITMTAGNDAVSIGDPRILPAPFAGPGGGLFGGVIFALNQPMPIPAPLGAVTTVQEDVTVKLGQGDDLLVTNLLAAGRDLTVDTQTAARLNTWAAPLSMGFNLVDEAILGFNTAVARNATLNTQTGNDLVMLGAAGVVNGGIVGGQLMIAANDPLGIGDTIGMAVGDCLKINTRSGADSVFVNYTAANSVLDIQLDKGPDFCTLWGVMTNTSINVAGHSSEKKALVDAVFGLSNPAACGNFTPSINAKYAILA